MFKYLFFVFNSSVYKCTLPKSPYLLSDVVLRRIAICFNVHFNNILHFIGRYLIYIYYIELLLFSFD